MSASWAALFDWDGVVIDSSLPHQKSWERMAQEDGLTLAPGFFEQAFGMKNETIIPELLHWATDPDEVARLAFRKESIYRDILLEEGIDALPGVEPFLQSLAEMGVPCVIASSTCRLNIEAAIDRIGLRRYFRDIVSGDDVVHGKPAPDIFLKAADRAGRAPSKCVVFEDAHVGVEAAQRAGMRVVAVTTTHPAASFKSADRVVDRLDILNADDIGRWFSASTVETGG